MMPACGIDRCFFQIFGDNVAYRGIGQQPIWGNLFTMGTYTPHSFRHSTATHMLEAGVPLMAIKQFLGHASIQTTQVYAELSQNTVDKYVKEWNEKWFPKEIHSNEKKDDAEEGNMPSFLNV